MKTHFYLLISALSINSIFCMEELVPKDSNQKNILYFAPIPQELVGHILLPKKSQYKQDITFGPLLRTREVSKLFNAAVLNGLANCPTYPETPYTCQTVWSFLAHNNQHNKQDEYKELLKSTDAIFNQIIQTKYFYTKQNETAIQNIKDILKQMAMKDQAKILSFTFNIDSRKRDWACGYTGICTLALCPVGFCSDFKTRQSIEVFFTNKCNKLKCHLPVYWTIKGLFSGNKVNKKITFNNLLGLSVAETYSLEYLEQFKGFSACHPASTITLSEFSVIVTHDPFLLDKPQIQKFIHDNELIQITSGQTYRFKCLKELSDPYPMIQTLINVAPNITDPVTIELFNENENSTTVFNGTIKTLSEQLLFYDELDLSRFVAKS